MPSILSFHQLAQLNNHPLLLFSMRLRIGASPLLSFQYLIMQLLQVFQMQNIVFKNQQLHLKYLCDLARHWTQTPWRWHDSIEICKSVIFCEFIAHMLVIAQNNLKKNPTLLLWKRTGTLNYQRFFFHQLMHNWIVIKNNFKFALKLTLKSYYMFRRKTPSSDIQNTFFFTYIPCVLIIIKVFSPTYALLDSLKKQF